MKQEKFKPYIPANKITSELTPTAILLGLALAVMFGAANAYLGLKVGMTISASIPAAVMSMAIIRIIMKRDSILENNMVQTIGSAGESLASGVIFTMPALFIWAREGVMEVPSLITITVIALFGGLLGVFFMVPLRNALIVQEHGILPYPEGTACAEVLLAGEEGGAAAKAVFAGIGISAVIKFILDGLCAIPGVITMKLEALRTELSAEVYPALLAVGYICGIKIDSYMLAGGVLGWFVLIPAIVFFGQSATIFPGKVPISEIYATAGAGGIWSSYIRYVGAGAVAAAGNDRTARDLDIRIVLGFIAVLIVSIWLIPSIPLNLFGALLVVIFGFFFVAVSSRMVGLVGSSNNPVSGMTIATLLVCTVLLKLSGDTGAHGMQGAIAIGSIICIAAAMAGDTSQDLKTGYILGATPQKQQIGEIMGSIVAALVIGGVMILLDKAYQFGSEALAAPQATMMKMIIEGVMEGNLPWSLIFMGVFISITIEVLGIPALPVAIGLYLPLELSTTLMVGGIVRYFADRKNSDAGSESGKGILFCSGLIAGEGLLGVLLAILTVFGITDVLNISESLDTGMPGAILLFVAINAMIYKVALSKK